MSSGKRSKRSDRNQYYRDTYDGYNNEGSGVYTRGYAPWQWGYWASDNMAYAGKDDAFYSIQDDRSRSRGHYAGNMYDNAGYQGYKHGRGGGSYKLKTSSNSDGFSEYPGEGSDKSTRRCCVVMAVVGTMFLLGAGLAIGIYFGVVDKPESMRQPDIPATTVAPAPALLVDMSLKIDRTFDTDLNNPDSQAYKNLETEVKEEIDQNMKASPLADSYTGTDVLGFSPGSIEAATKLKFANKKFKENNVDEEITADKVVTKLKVQLTQSNSVLFTKDSITAKISTAVGDVGLDERCSSPSDCSVSNTLCTGSPSVCQCVDGYFDSNGNTKKGVCVKEKEFGTSCSQKTDCKTVDAECIGTPKVCSCVTGTYHNTGINACRPKLNNGDSGCTDASLQCLVPGAACLNGKCDCETGYQLKDDNCTKLIEHGESGCSVDSDCITPNAICAVNECQCAPANYFSMTTKVCEPKKDNGAICTDVKECRITGAECINKVCSCSPGNFLNGNECSQQVAHGETCVGSKPNECATQDAVCDETSKKCTCKEMQYLNGNKCIDKIPYQGLCAKADHCLTTNAVCPLTKCVCEIGFYYDTDSDSCMKIKDFGQECDTDMQCLTNAKCTSGKCACPSDMYEDEDKCSKKKNNKESCKNTAQCLFENAECVDVCRCPEGRFENENICELQVGNGNLCKGLPNECLVKDAECDGTDETCKCPETKFLNGEVCIDKTGNGQKCIQSVECKYDFAICVSEFCTCPTDRYGDTANEICQLKVNLNEACTSDDMCKFEGAKCGNEKKCVCLDSTYAEGEACKEKKVYGVECGEVSQCATKSSICSGIPKMCTCDAGFYHDANADECMAVKSFGEDCLTDDMCSMNSECISNKCACPSGFYEDNNKCSEKKLNQVACGDVKECAVMNAECNKVCQCPIGTYEDGVSCKDQIDYEAECSVNAACKTKFSECSTATKTCLCPSTMFRDSSIDTCKDKTGDGEACGGDNECSFKDAICSSGYCACPEGKFVDNNDKQCNDKKPLGGDCEDQVECIDKSICEAKKCACPATAFEKDGQCSDKSPSGGYCDSTDECSTKNAVCKENVCDCEDTDYLKENKCVAKKTNGVECGDSKECSSKDAICDQTCKCPDQYKLIDTACMKLIPYGSECSDVQLCMTTDSVCAGDQTNTCTCADDKYHDSDSNSCKSLLEHEETGCVDAVLQCKTEDAACIDGKCSCASGTFFFEGKCRAGQENGETCVTNDWCKITNAICDTICKCETGFYSDGTACVEKIQYDSPCTPDEQCKTTNGLCVIGKCGCNENYYYDSNSDQCLLKKSYNTACNNKLECITQNAECQNNLCLCPDNKYFNGVSCEDKKDIGEICEETEECGIEGSFCDVIECQCPDDTYYDGSCKKKVGLGEACGDSSHCSYTNAECTGNQCACPTGTYSSGTTCMAVKSHGAQCSSNEECKTQTCDNNKCSCLATQYYDSANEMCKLKEDYNGVCSEADQCSTDSVECSAGTCVCSSGFLFNSEKNACFISIGGTCETADMCSTANAECLSGSCTCGTGKFIDTFANSCEDKKGNGIPCGSNDECMDGFECDGECTCPQDTYLSGTTCMQRKLNGFPCETVGECSVKDTQCIDKTCQCSPTMYLSDNECVSRLNFGQACQADGNCMEMFVCMDSICSCEEGYMYDEDISNCTMIIPTTAIPTTIAPDEEVVITTEGTLVSNETYNPDYSDPNSPAYIQKKAEIEESLSDATTNDTTVEVARIIPGSIILVFKFKTVKKRIIEKIDTPTGSLEVVTEEVTKTLTLQITKTVNNVAKKLEEKGVFKGIKVPEEAVKIQKEPCLDDLLMKKRANKDICASVLRNLQGLRNNPNKRCSSYKDLLTCVALQYQMADTTCPWNNFRTNLEKFVLPELGLEEETFKPCVDGNFFNFLPIGGQVTVQNPCKDLTTMKIVAKSECTSEYNVISMARGRTDVCSYSLDLESCVNTVIIQKFSNQYRSCEAEADVNLNLQGIIDSEVEFFETKHVALEKCEFCLPPNVYHIFTTKCGRSMKNMVDKSPEEACGMLHQELQCIETHLKKWSENHKCTMDNIKSMFKTDKRFLEHGQRYLPWLNETSMDECLASEMRHLGPAEPESICTNQNYIFYVLSYSQCFEYIIQATTGGCYSLYQAVECVRELMEKENMECSYKDLERSILKTSTEYNTISSTLEPKGSMEGCILDKAENACQSSIHYIAFTRAEDISKTCLYNLLSVLYLKDPQFIKPYNANKGSLACNILDQGALCTYAIFSTGNKLCTLGHAYKYIKETLPSLVKGMIDSIENPAEKPSNDEMIYSTCTDDISTIEDYECAADSTVINSLTASCAPLLMHAEEGDKCQIFEGCVDGAKAWHEAIPACPGYLDTLEKGKNNEDLAKYFFRQSGFQWMTCFEESFDHDVDFGFPQDEFNPDFENLASDAATSYIREKMKLLLEITEGRPVEVTALSPLVQRRKRQNEQEATGTEMATKTKGPRDLKEIMNENVKNLPVSQQRNLILKSTTINDGSHPGECPAIEAYSKKCVGFMDQCASDKDCNNTQKCCNDENANFCVDSVTQATEYKVELTLNEEEWTEDTTSLDEKLKAYRTMIGRVFEDFMKHSLSDRRQNRENNIVLVYSVFAYQNPRSVIHKVLKDTDKISLSASFLVAKSYEVKDHCPQNLLIMDFLLKCINEQFTDHQMGYQDYEVCGAVSNLASCVTNKCNSEDMDDCDIEMDLMKETESILNRVTTHSFENGTSRRISSMIAEFDAEKCSEKHDVNPCEDIDMLKNAMEECKDTLQTVDASDPFGVDFCSIYSEFSSCVIVRLRSKGAQWCEEYQIKDNLIRLLGLQPYFFILPNFNERCPDNKKALCTFSALRELSWSECKLRPYIQYGSCSNETVKEVLVDFVACVRIQSLKDLNDCPVEKILDIIKKDRYHLGIIDQEEDVDNCITEETINAISSELKDKEDVCHSGRAMKYFYMECFDDDCKLKLQLIEDTNTRCTLLYQQLSCVQSNMKNVSFECSFDQLMTTAGDLTDKSFPLSLSLELSTPCKEKMTKDDMESCDIPLLSRTNGSKECVEHLLPDLSKLTQDQQCKLASVGGNCLSAAAKQVDATCDEDAIPSVLKDIIAATSVAMRHLECKYDDNKPKSFEDCEDDLTTMNLCDSSEVDTLINLVRLHCDQTLKDAEKKHMSLISDYQIDEQTLICSGFEMFATCGANTTKKVHLACELPYVKQTLIGNQDKLSDTFTGKNIQFCIKDECQTKISAQIKKCVPRNIKYELYGEWTCRIYNLLYHCVKSGLQENTCTDAKIKDHLFLELYQPNYDNPFTKCKVEEKSPSVCTDIDLLNKLTESVCHTPVYTLRDTCSETNRKAALDCIANMTRRYDSTCEETEVQTQAKIALVNQDRYYEESKIRDCLPETIRDGYCPLQQATSNCRVCEAMRQDECTSDLECTGEQKCCFDGCKRSCIATAKDPITMQTRLLLINVEWKSTNNEPESEKRNEYKEILENLMGYLGNKVKTASPTFNLSKSNNTELTELSFTYQSFVSKEEMKTMIAKYVEENKLRITHLVTIYNNNDGVDVIQEKEGTCPRLSLEWLNRPYEQHCCNDFSCNDDKKCCRFSDYQQNCVSPVKETLKDCGDTEVIQAALTKCDLNLEMLASYSCSELFSDKMKCVLTEVNKGRNTFTLCDMEGLRLDINKTIPEQYNTIPARQKLFSCRLLQVRITAEPPMCNLTTPAFEAYETRLKAALANLDGFEKIQEFCRYQKFRVVGRFYTDKDIYTVENSLYNDLNPNMRRRRRQSNEDTFLKSYIEVNNVNESRIYWCDKVELSKSFGLTCFYETSRWHDEEYKKCGSVFDFFECYKSKFRSINNRDTYKDCELSDEMLKTEVIPYIEEEIKDANEYNPNFEKLTSYDSKKCYDRGIDINPCYDDEKRNEAYLSCQTEISYPSTLSLSDPKNCRKFYDLSFCVASKLRDFGSRCSFYDIDEYTVKRLMAERDISMDSGNWTCTSHKPVCSANYIMDSLHGECWRNMSTYQSSFNCSTETGKMNFKKFVQCLAIDRLFKQEMECTVSKIMDMIKKDKFNLDLTGRTDINLCLSVEEQSKLELDFEFGQNLCKSEAFLEHVTPNCLMHYDGQDVRRECPYDSDGEYIDTSGASCSYLTQVMSCVKEDIMESVKVECKLVDLVGTNIPVNSMPRLSEEDKGTCIGKLENSKCIQHELSMNYDAALQCAKAGKYSSDPFLDNDEDSRLCRILEYSLVCLKSLVSEACTDFTEVDLYRQYTSLMEYIEMERSLTDCVKYETPDLPDCDVPKSVLEDKNDCENADFITNVVIGYCSMESRGNSTNRESDGSECLRYPALLSCGMEVTRKLRSLRDDEDGKEVIGCTREQIDSALQSEAEEVEKYLSLKLEDCQGACYVDIEQVVTKCVQMTLGLGPYGNSTYNEWQKGCSAYKYAYQCVHLEKPGCDIDLKKAVLDSAIAKYGRNLYRNCKNPAYEPELDVCTNVTDMIELSAGLCGRHIHALLNTTASQQNQGNCKNQTELTMCMEHILESYKGVTSRQEICGEKTNSIIGKVAMVYVRKHFRYDYGTFEMKLATVKKCFGFDERNGHCPYVDVSQYHYNQGPVTCVIDEDCTESEHKCCFNGPTFVCRSPSTIKEKFTVLLHLLKVEWKDEFYTWGNNETQNMIKPHLQWIQNICTENGWTCGGYYLTEEKSYRRKRQAAPMSSTNLHFEVGAVGNPATTINKAIQRDEKTDNYRVTSERIDDGPSTNCEDVETIYTSIINKCPDYIHKLFNSQEMSSEKCLAYKNVTTCVKKDLNTCEERTLEKVIDDKLHDIFDIFKTKGKIDDQSEFPNIKLCANDSCWSEDLVLNATIGTCLGALKTLSDVSQMDTNYCMNVLSLTKCVADTLTKITMHKCNRSDTENLIGKVMRSERFQMIAKNISLNYSMINFEMCKGKVCHPQQLTQYAKDDCKEAFEAYMKDENCIHTLMFSGCVKFQALGKGEICSFKNVSFILKNWGDEIIKNSDVEVPANQTRSFDWCPGDNMTAFEKEFPKSFADICGYFGVNHYNVRYTCMSNMPGMFLSDDEQCIYREYITGCLHEVMEQYQCTLEDSKKALSNPRVLSGLLKSDLNCSEVVEELNHCDMHLLYLGKSHTDQCLHPIVSFLSYKLYDTSVNVNEVMTPDNDTLLKCSFLEDAAACFVHKTLYTGAEGNCPANSFKKIINFEVKLYQKVFKRIQNPYGADNFIPIDFDICTIPENVDGNFDECPESEVIVELLVGVCGPRLMITKMILPQIQPCMLSNAMTECYQNTDGILRLEKCDNEKKSNALAEYDEYLSPLAAGFSFKQCSGLSSCFEFFGQHTDCLAQYASLHLIAGDMTSSQKCTLLTYYRAKTIKCYENINFACGKHADDYLTTLVDVRDEQKRAFPDRDECTATYEMALRLTGEPFQEDYAQPESDAYQQLISRTNQKLKELFEGSGYEYSIEGASEMSSKRKKRQTEPDDRSTGITVLHLLITGSTNPAQKLQEILDSKTDLQESFQILSSKLHEESINLCNSMDKFGLMECGSLLWDPNVNCLLRGCFANLSLPEECKEESRQELAEDVFQSITQYKLGPCEKYDPLPCGPNYFHIATTDKCEDQWKAYNESNECQDYEDFITCIGVMAKKKGENCTLEHIHKNIEKEVKEKQLDATVCRSFQDLNTAFSKGDICVNGLINAYLLKQHCLNKDYFAEENTKNKCSLEMRMQHCMFALTSSFAGCHNFSNTTEAFKSEEVQSVLNNQDLKCDSTCERHVIMDLGQSIKKTCLHNPRSVLYLSDLPNIPTYGSQDYSFPCLVYLDAAQCIEGIYEPVATNVLGCTKEEFNKVLKENLTDLIEVMVIEGHFMGMPDPRNSAEDIYSKCTDKVFPLPTSVDCLNGDQMINTLTASCAAYVMGILGDARSVSDKCSALSTCLNGILDWHRMNPFCEGYAEAFMEKQWNTEYAAYFKNVTGLNWLECGFDDDDDKEDERVGKCPNLMEDENCDYSECDTDSDCLDQNQKCCENSCGKGRCVDPVDGQQLPDSVYRVLFELLRKPFDEDYKNLESEASKALIEELTPTLNMIILNKPWKIERFISTLEAPRRKRQAPEGTGNTIVVVSVTSQDNPEKSIQEAIIQNELSTTFSFRSSQAQVDCSAISCMLPECYHGDLYTPDGECCPQCKPGPTPCTPEYFERAVNEDCSSPWDRYSDSKKCWDYAAFVSCGWYHGFARNISCNLTQANNAVRNQTIESQLPGEFCTSDDLVTFEYVKNALPKNRKDICENVYINRALLDYYCLDKTTYDAMENEGKCLYEFGMRKCVNNILSSDFKCNISSTNNVFQKDELREGLLKSKTELDCDESYKCAIYLMTGIGEKMIDSCVGLASNVLHLPNIAEAKIGEKALTCLTYKYSLECAIHELMSDTEFRESCPVDGVIHDPFLGLIDMHATEDDERKPLNDVEIFRPCIGTVTIEEMGDCPEQGEELVTMVTGACAGEVNEALEEEETQASGCRALQECNRGIAEFYRSKSLCVDASPSIDERLQMNTNNEDFIAVFNNITDLDTGSCKPDVTMKTYEVMLYLRDHEYQVQFENITSIESRDFMKMIHPVLQLLFERRSFSILKLSQLGRYKRQDEPAAPSGVMVLTEVTASELNKAMLEESARNTGESIEIESIIPVYWPCLPDQESYNCFRNPCDDNDCKAYPDARCVSNYCDGCNAFFFNKDGKDVTNLCTAEEKPGRCPSFDEDDVSICLYQCSKDYECNGTQKCCDAPCGNGQCFEPVYVYRVTLELLTKPFKEEYLNRSSNDYMALVSEVQPMLDEIITIDGAQNRIIGFSPMGPNRVKRQTDAPNTKVFVMVEATKNPEEVINSHIQNDDTYNAYFNLLTSEVDECAMVDCRELTCEDQYKPDGECCPICEDKCYDIECDDISYCPEESVTRLPGECCDVCQTCTCEEPNCENPQPGEGECKCPVCPPLEKPGRCPSFDEDDVSTCLYQCSKDYECNGTQKCCDVPCGKGQCFEPVYVYRVTLELLTKPFKEEYLNRSSNDYMALVSEVQPMLDEIITIDGAQNRIIGFSPMEPNRVKRQTDAPNTKVFVIVEATKNPEEVINSNIQNEDTYNAYFNLLTSEVDECSMVDCRELTCEDQYKPDDECCPICEDKCYDIECDDISYCPEESVTRLPGECCDVCQTCTCEEPNCENPQPGEGECKCPVCPPLDCARIIEIGWASEFPYIAERTNNSAEQCRIFVNTTLMVMDRTMGNYTVEEVNECLLTKLRDTEQDLADSLGPCVMRYYRMFEMNVMLNYLWNKNYSNPQTKMYLEKKYLLISQVKSSVKELQSTDNMFVLVKKLMSAKNEANPEEPFTAAYIDLVVANRDDQTPGFEWTQLEEELMNQEGISNVELLENKTGQETDNGEENQPSKPTTKATSPA